MGTGPLGLGVLPNFIPGGWTGTPFDNIRRGSRVTISTKHGTRKGRATLYNRSQNLWVLNMGGAHGTPGIATPDNVVAVS